MLFEVFLEGVNFMLKALQAFGERIWQVGMVQLDPREVAILDPRNAPWHPDHRRVLWHVTNDHRIRTHHGVGTNRDVT